MFHPLTLITMLLTKIRNRLSKIAPKIKKQIVNSTSRFFRKIKKQDQFEKSCVSYKLYGVQECSVTVKFFFIDGVRQCMIRLHQSQMRAARSNGRKKPGLNKRAVTVLPDYLFRSPIIEKKWNVNQYVYSMLLTQATCALIVTRNS